MKAIHAVAAPFRAALSALLLLGAGAPLVAPAFGQASPNTPERMTYQGFLVGSDGVALGGTAPKNYDVIFKIYNDASAGALKWAEQQTVTVDKGYFSVLLGEGASTGDPHPDLSTIFRGGDASERWVAVTVKGIGAGGANVDILPRLRLLSAPYAYLAQQAVKLVQNTGSDLLTSSGNQVTLNGSLDMTSGNSLEFGANVAGKQPDAGRLGYQLFSQGLDIVGAGLTGSDRKVTIWAEGGLSVNGSVSALSYSGSGANLSGVAKLGANTFTGTQYINVGHLQFDNQYQIQAKNNAGTMETFLWPRWSDNVSYLNYGAGGFWIRNNNGGTLYMSSDNRSTFQGAVYARGGYPGAFNANNVGYAFSGNGGDNDSGMFSDQDGHVRFTSNGNLRFSVYPSGAYVHDGSLTVDSFNNTTTFRVTGDVIQVFNGSNKAKYFQMYRYASGVAIQGFGGGWANASGDFRQITWDGDGNWDSSSDRKMKKDIVDAEPVLDRALQVRVRRFHWKDDPDDAKLAMGVIAQELQPLFPDLISVQENPTTKETNLAVGYSDFGLIAIKAIQELKQQHEAEVTDLKAQLAELKSQMTAVLQANPQIPVQTVKNKQTASVDR